MPAWGDMLKKTKTLLNKYKFLLIIVAVGIIFLLLPTGQSAPAPETPQQSAAGQLPSTEPDEAKIESALAQIAGVGRVKATLSLKTGSEVIYANEVRNSNRYDGSVQSPSSSDQEYQPVLVSKSSGGQEPLVIKCLYPEYKGALIICDGADDAGVKLRVVDAVSSLLGLGTDKIVVLKMKSD